MVMGSLRQEAEVAVIGAGPGGYVAAIRAADLGKEVVLIDERERPGGVCLLEGCIPSKTLISAVELVFAAREAKKFGVSFSEPSFDLEALRKYTAEVVGSLSSGVSSLLAKRGVEVIRGRARFQASRSLFIEGSGVSGIDFRTAVIATGSRPSRLAAAGDLPLWTSADALGVPEIPRRLLVVGGGYIGLELGQLYAGLGSEVVMVEMFPRLIAGADEDLLRVVLENCRMCFKDILVESRVAAVEKTSSGLLVTVEHDGGKKSLEADRVLVAVGRKRNTGDLGLETTAVRLDAGGAVSVDEENRTADPFIFAIGDVTPGPMLAHKASREAKVAAEVIAGRKSAFDNRSIPAVVYTDPEIAWVGLTEREAKEKGLTVDIGRFPLRALGRARTLGRTDGLTKVIADRGSGLILGVGMAGPHASDLIAEAALALEMGATLEDLIVTIHPHPSLSESLMEAAESAAGLPVHIFPQKKKVVSREESHGDRPVQRG